MQWPEFVFYFNEMSGAFCQDSRRSFGTHSSFELIQLSIYIQVLIEVLKQADGILESREIGYIDASPAIATMIQKFEPFRTEEQFYPRYKWKVDDLGGEK